MAWASQHKRKNPKWFDPVKISFDPSGSHQNSQVLKGMADAKRRILERLNVERQSQQSSPECLEPFAAEQGCTAVAQPLNFHVDTRRACGGPLVS